MKQAHQPILGIIAPSRRPLSPSQKEMLRRSGSVLRIGAQWAAARKAREDDERLEKRDRR